MVSQHVPPDEAILRRFLLGQLPPVELEAVSHYLDTHPELVSTLDSLRAGDPLVDTLRSAPATSVTDTPDLRDLIDRAAALADGPPAGGGLPPGLLLTSSVPGDGTLSAPASPPQPESVTTVVSVTPHSADAELSEWLAPAQAAGELGRVDSYRVFRVIGRGGMGAVFEAEDLKLGRRVALKVMLPTLAANPTAKKRFLLEARTAATVEHDHIVPIFQVGEDRGMPFIAMPFLRGEPLDNALRGGKALAVTDVLLIGRQVAEGLAAAHAAGLIHRDIKPSNIWLERHADGTFKRARILDFGLARSIREAGEHLTHSGAILGTPAYMAPEQARGVPVDHRADLFSLGGVLYQMATGRRAFPGTDTFAILAALTTDHPTPPREFHPSLPPALSELILQLLAKAPADRPESAQTVANELIRIATDLALHPTTGTTTELLLAPTAPASALDLWEGVAAGAAEVDITPQPAPSRRGVGHWFWVAVGVMFLGLVGLGGYYGKTIVRVATNQGELVIEVDDPTIEVKVKQGEAVLINKTKNREFVLKGGSGEVEFIDPETGVKTVTRKFEIIRGDKTVVKATMAEVAEPRPKPKVEAKPDPERQAAEVLHPFAFLMLRLSSGTLINITQSDTLPVEPFVVVHINWSGASINEAIQAGRITKSPTASDFWPAIERLGYLTELCDDTAFLLITDDQLARLADSYTAANINRLHLGFNLSTNTLKILKRFPHLTGIGCWVNIADDEVLCQLHEVANFDTIWFHQNPEFRQLGPTGLTALTKLPIIVLALDGRNLLNRDIALKIAAMPHLDTLLLANHVAGDELSQELSRCPRLTLLGFWATNVSDAGLEHLRDLRSLRVLQLHGTNATEAGIKKLAAARPDLCIEWDGVVIEPKKP